MSVSDSPGGIAANAAGELKPESPSMFKLSQLSKSNIEVSRDNLLTIANELSVAGYDGSAQRIKNALDRFLFLFNCIDQSNTAFIEQVNTPTNEEDPRPDFTFTALSLHVINKSAEILEGAAINLDAVGQANQAAQLRAEIQAIKSSHDTLSKWEHDEVPDEAFATVAPVQALSLTDRLFTRIVDRVGSEDGVAETLAAFVDGIVKGTIHRVDMSVRRPNEDPASQLANPLYVGPTATENVLHAPTVTLANPEE